jgi:hypothetical protein
MSKKNNLYLGKAGQFALMSEFLCRGWNVATPEVDVGDDIFVVRDSDGNFVRIQVKTATGSQLRGQIRAQFSIPVNQLETPVAPMLVYAFLVRFDGRWLYFALVRQDDLQVQVQNFEIEKTGNAAFINLWFKYHSGKLSCRDEDFSAYLFNFNDFPIVRH